MKPRPTTQSATAVLEYRHKPRQQGEPPIASRGALHLSDLLLLLAVGLWAFGLSQVHVTRLGPYGLPPELPVPFYAGFAVFLVSATCELTRARISSWRMAAHAVALVFMLYGTAPLLYYEGRYEWLYKTVGVVQYVNAHGSLNPRIDIYQNWPGFFALTAWFDKVAGVSSPLAYAKWAQAAFELAALPLLYLIYSAFSLSDRQRWLAILLYSASNWIGQDYFSPQAMSTVLCLGLMATAMRWLYVEKRPRAARTRRRGRAGRDRLMSRPTGGRSRPSPPRVAAIIVIIVIFSYIIISHQISPYMLVDQLGALALFGLLRPRWLPVVLGALAIAYLIPHYSIASQYGLTASIGHFFSNVKPPSASAPNVSPPEAFIQRSAEALSFGVWALAGLGAWLNRQARRKVLALVLLAYSPVLVLAGGAYGNEGILRVYLFSLAWSAALGAMALAPSRTAVRAGQTSRVALAARHLRRAALSVAAALRVSARWRSPGAVRIPVTLAVALALFFPSFFGDDSFNYMSKAEVAVVTSFWRHAQAGHVFVAVDAAPMFDTGRYNLFSWSPIFGSTLRQSSAPITYSIADQLAQRARAKSHGRAPAYVMVTDNMVAYNNAYGLTNPASFHILLYSLQHSPYWTRIINHAGVIVYEMQAQVQSAGSIP